VIGATPINEALEPKKYEEILHLMPGLKRLDVAFVGSEVRMYKDPCSCCEYRK